MTEYRLYFSKSLDGRRVFAPILFDQKHFTWPSQGGYIRQVLNQHPIQRLSFLLLRDTFRLERLYRAKTDIKQETINSPTHISLTKNLADLQAILFKLEYPVKL
ncbi:hypothetical protein IPC725_30735 [Pseudomonas aeruginosa]|nr:hypothetical protein IPC725_30735 [Pseudomonas aeruginosa]